MSTAPTAPTVDTRAALVGAPGPDTRYHEDGKGGYYYFQPFSGRLTPDIARLAARGYKAHLAARPETTLRAAELRVEAIGVKDVGVALRRDVRHLLDSVTHPACHWSPVIWRDEMVRAAFAGADAFEGTTFRLADYADNPLLPFHVGVWFFDGEIDTVEHLIGPCELQALVLVHSRDVAGDRIGLVALFLYATVATGDAEPDLFLSTNVGIYDGDVIIGPWLDVLPMMKFAGLPFAVAEPEPTPRNYRRWLERKNLPQPEDVRVIKLRETKYAHREQNPVSGGVEWSCRWLVEGHWRKQWYPAKGEHNTIWIDSYLKGPDGAPFKAPALVPTMRVGLTPASCRAFQQPAW